MTGPLSRRLLLTAACVVCLFAGQASFPPLGSAHLGRISYSDVAAKGNLVFYRLRCAAHVIPGLSPRNGKKLTRPEVIAGQAEILHWLSTTVLVASRGTRCEPQITEIIGPDRRDDLTVLLRYQCSSTVQSLRIDFHAFDGLSADYQNIVSLRMAGTTSSYVFTPANHVLVAGRTPAAETVSFKEFFQLGVAHIWTGYDHLLFLLALLLPGGRIRRLAGIVTAFTIAHSITLSLATLGLVRIAPEPIEIAIAASIVFVASQNLIHSRSDHRWLITFVFGLVHGFGFASVLQQAGLEPGSVLVPLFSFNLGVEVGQLAVVTVVIPLLRLAMRANAAPRIRSGLSWGIIAAGLFWMVQRAAVLLV